MYKHEKSTCKAKRAEQLFFTIKYVNLGSLRNDDGNGND